MILVVVNLVFAGLAGWVVLRWRDARRAVVAIAVDGVDLRVRARPPDEEQVEEWVERARRGIDPLPPARTSGPVVGDSATLVELAADSADAVVSSLVGVLLADGFEVRKTKGRRVHLRRGADHVVIDVAPSA